MVGSAPLDEFFGEGAVRFTPNGGTLSYGRPELTEALILESEQLVAECMADAGFEYTPNVAAAEAVISSQDARSLPRDEFVGEYGYGVATLDRSLPEDPNREYRESLAPEALEAYKQTLLGALAEANFMEEPPTVDELGCRGEANAEAGRPSVLENNPYQEFGGLLDDVHALSDRIHADARLDEAAELWLGCMADAGYPDFERVGDAEQWVREQMEELAGWAEVDELRASGEFDAADELTEELVLAEPDPDELAELQEDEIELAVADRDCLAEHYDQTFTEVSVDLQEEFIEQHRDELERFRDWVQENDPVGELVFDPHVPDQPSTGQS